ncbi:MAG TPA: protein translocase subunit SecF, partial [Spirochaetes bacterium]|nr:protein translocase subunit SecF [Spirochaetota bacterium]
TDLLKSVQYNYQSTVREIKNTISDLGEGSNVDVIAMGDDNTEFRIRASLGKSIPKADKVKLIENEVIHPLKEKYSALKILSLPDYEALVNSLSIDLGEDSSVADLQDILGKAVAIKAFEKGNQSKYIMDTTFSQLIAKKKVEEPLQKKFPQLNIKDNTTYDPTQGAAIKEQAFLVSLLVLALILLYIGIRFEFKFGVAAIIALVHDVIVVLCFVLFFDREVDIPTVVALLTIMGYSLNDTIVIFDRIRENKEILATEDNNLVVNNSINQSLSRTIVTSLTTLFVVTCLLFLGGPALENLSFALFVGVIVGTYSSIFVASPVLVIWENFLAKRDSRKVNKLRKSAPGKKTKKSEDKVVV